MVDERFSNLEIMDLIKDCESKYPVDTWTIDNIHIWPLIRNNLPHLVIAHFNSSKKSTSNPSIKHDNLLFMTYNFFSSIYLVAKILINSIFLKNCDTLLVSDGVSYSKVNDIWVERFCDPVTDSLRKKSKNFLFLEQLKNNKDNTLNKYISISYVETISYYIARLWAFFKKHDTALFAYDDFLSNVQIKRFISHLSQKEMSLTVSKIKICSFFFDIIIKIYGIKRIFIVCYYGIIGYSLSLASRKNNIELTDIEHGSIFNCPAYCGWSKVPENGYELLPHRFELWHHILHDEFINSNHLNFIKFHQAKVSGLRILEYIKQNQNLKNEVVKNFKKKYDYLILVTLQPQFFGLNDWDKLTEVIKVSPKNWGWVVRSHPAYKDLCGMEKILSISQDNIIHDNASFNLYELLESTNCHVTTASASCLEAMLFEVPTLFISEVALEDFSILIQKKLAYYAATKKQIVDNLNSLLYR